MRFSIDLNKDVEIRSYESHMHDVEYVMNEKNKSKNVVQRTSKKQLSYRGVKSLAKIVNLTFFDCVWGFPIEYMHGMI